jgi:hypothetical protein
MKKLIIAMIAMAAVLSATNIEARHKTRGAKAVEIHRIYTNGEIQNVEHKMVLKGFLWKVEQRNGKQIWTGYAVGDEAIGEIAKVKLKGNDYKSFVKVNVDGKRSFVKDIYPVSGYRHLAKIRQEGERYVVKDIVHHNGSEIVTIK